MTTREYNQCVDMHADGLYRFILKNIKDEEKARDVVQDTFEKLWIKVADVPFEKCKSYLFTAGYHTMIDKIRREKKIGSMEEAKPMTLATQQKNFELKKILDDALATLPEAQRSVILLRDYEGYSYDEIGQIMQLTESQVKVYIFRGRQTLKKILGSVEAVL
ncbi:MAG: RNA polymerase sigma factor [Flavobacteriales bacterium]|nr:RNA polymerase sigma factor [Flavobacteriales bacterium]MCB9449390.1 RNA polymerase sigma factor [Flavobacteriales bacterium]